MLAWIMKNCSKKSDVKEEQAEQNDLSNLQNKKKNFGI